MNTTHRTAAEIKLSNLSVGETMTTLFGFETLVDGVWNSEACGAQGASNYFATREEAEAELVRLAHVLDCDVSELRVVEVQS